MGESKKRDEGQTRGEYTYTEAGASEGEGGRRLKKFVGKKAESGGRVQGGQCGEEEGSAR
jgi:hypothetical protein